MADYIPDSDVEFSAWLERFLTYAEDNLVDLHLVAADTAPLVALRSQFDEALTLINVIDAQLKGARATRANIRVEAEQAIRSLARRIQATPAVTDEQRQRLGITVRSTTRTPVSAPTTRPVATIDTTQRLQHTLAFVDELTPTSRAKPDGASGCEIWVNVYGPPPTDPSELKYLATDTRSP
jgi:hypothetical protein